MDSIPKMSSGNALDNLVECENYHADAGRVRIVLYAYRPGRCYIRLAMQGRGGIMGLGVYLKKDIRAILVGLVAAAIETHAAGGGASCEHVAGVLTLSKGMALSLGLPWSVVLADVRAGLGAAADGLLSAAMDSLYGNSAPTKTIDLQIINTGSGSLEVTSFTLTGAEEFTLVGGQGEWEGSAETAAGIKLPSPIEIEEGASRVIQVRFAPSSLEAASGGLRFKCGPSSCVRVDWIEKDSPYSDQDEE